MEGDRPNGALDPATHKANNIPLTLLSHEPINLVFFLLNLSELSVTKRTLTETVPNTIYKYKLMNPHMGNWLNRAEVQESENSLFPERSWQSELCSIKQAKTTACSNLGFRSCAHQHWKTKRLGRKMSGI